MFEMFDQFLYLSVLMFGAYITLYIKSRSYSGILLIACSILSNILLFSIVLDPFVFIALPITAVLLLKDFFDDYKTGIVKHKHKLGAIIACVIIIYDVIFIMKIASFQLIDSYSLFTVGSVIGTITGIYLVVYPFKEMMAEREENLSRINQEVEYNNRLEVENQMQLEDLDEVDTVNMEIERLSGESYKVNKASKTDDQIDQRTEESKHLGNGSKQSGGLSGSYGKLLGIDILYFIVGGLAVLLVLIVIGYNLMTRTVIDMQDYVFVTVEPEVFEDAKVGYYASFEHLNKNNFYDDLISEGYDYGLSEEQITKYTPHYTTALNTMWNKLDIKVANDKETVNNGDIVTTNITYNEKYAVKNNIIIKNSNFETEVTNMPSYITNSSQLDKNSIKSIAATTILDSKKVSKYDLSTAIPKFYTIEEDGHIKIIASYTDVSRTGFLDRKTDLSFKLVPYLKNGELQISSDIEIVDSDDYELTDL